MKKILIDVFGSDHPEQLLEGCARCTLEVPDVMLVLPGEEAMLRAELEKYPCNWDALEFMPASEIITNHDDPIDAVMHKRDSTLVKGMQRLKRDPELAGMLSPPGAPAQHSRAAWPMPGASAACARPRLPHSCRPSPAAGCALPTAAQTWTANPSAWSSSL